MTAKILNASIVLSCASIFAGCASSPEAEFEQAAREARIEEILSAPLDEEEYGPVKRCLRKTEYRNFRALDDRHILFEGSRGRYWVNTLRTRCSDLRHGTTLVVRSFSSMGQLCDADRFEASEWFDWPWYRRWPWSWQSSWSTGMTCALGKFQPVSETQAKALREAVKAD